MFLNVILRGMGRHPRDKDGVLLHHQVVRVAPEAVAGAAPTTVAIIGAAGVAPTTILCTATHNPPLAWPPSPTSHGLFMLANRSLERYTIIK